MNKLLPVFIAIALIVGALFIATHAQAAAPVTQPINGGTGSTTLSGILLGAGTSPVKTLLVGSGLSLSGGTLSATGAGGIISTSSALVAGQAVYATGVSTIASVGTSTPTLGLGLSYSGTLGSFLNGASGALTIATSSLYSGTTGQFPYFIGTNTLTGTSTIQVTTAGKILIGSSSPGTNASYLDVTAPGTGNVQTLAIRSNPGGTGTFGANYNGITFDNTNGSNFKNQFSLRAAGVEKWAIGNDVNAAGASNFYIYDDTNNKTALYIDGSSFIQTVSGGVYGFSNNSSAAQSGSMDTGISRGGAGILDIGTGGAASAAGTLLATKIGLGTTTPAAQLSLGGGNLLVGAATAGGTAGNLILGSVTGTQCLHAINGVVSGTGSDCGSATGGAAAFTPTSYGAATSTTLGFTGGFLDTASTTFTSSPNFDSLFAQTINPDTSAADSFNFGGRPSVGIPVPYVRPTQSNQNIAFDIFPNGTPGNGFGSSIYGVAWEDICSTDIFAGPNYECLHLGKALNGASNVSSSQGGTGLIQPLAFQLFGGNTGVGTSSPYAYFAITASTTAGSPTEPLFAIASSSTDLIVSNSGLVGIGTAAPQALLTLGTPFAPYPGTMETLDNGTQNSFLGLGQDASHQLFFGWNYNASAGSGYASIATYGYTNPLYIDASSILLGAAGSGAKVGVGTSTPWGVLSVTGAGGTNPLFAVSSSTAAASANAVFEIDKSGHILTSGPKPNISSCGTGTPTVIGNDEDMYITTGSSAASCVINFATAWVASRVVCTANEDGASVAMGTTVSLTQVTVTPLTSLTTKNINVMCQAFQ